MDSAKAQFLFGVDAPDLDPNDEGALLEYIEADLAGDVEPIAAAVRTIITRQIMEDTPPETWLTAQRLLDAGLGRDVVLGQIMAVETSVVREVETTPGGRRDPNELLVELLQSLPLPTGDDIGQAVESVVSQDQGLTKVVALRRAVERLDRIGDELTETVVTGAIDSFVGDEGRLVDLPGDRLVYLPGLTQGIVLTHRVTDAELRDGVLARAHADLCGFSWRDDVRHPSGWQETVAAGDVVSMTLDDEGRLNIDRLAAAPAADAALIRAVRGAYYLDQSGLPVLMADIVALVLLEDRGAFAEPEAPLVDLCDAAGLEVRGGLVGDRPEQWDATRLLQRVTRVHEAYEDDGHDDRADEILDVIEDFEDPDAAPADLRDGLGVIDDGLDSSVIVDELIPSDGATDEEIHRARAIAERLVRAARRPRERMMAHWIAALVEERVPDAIAAEQHLRVAFDSDASWGPLIDRVAWYASDRGDAATAVRTWRLIERPNPIELTTVERYAAPAHPRIGRNDACWCGSGRKFKVCHLGAIQRAPLPDRVAWLCQKAAGYLERGPEGAFEDVMELAHCRADHAGEGAATAASLGDPIVLDAALTELGWFERFLEARGALLPDDEVLLAQTWVLIERTVYDVEDVRAGEGLGLRDLRTGDHLEVREQALSRQLAAGDLICARAVPDGRTHQLIGGWFPVRPGREKEVLDLCDAKDANELCHDVASIHRPPTFTTREGEPIVMCTLTLNVPDPVVARQVLDQQFAPEDGAWVEYFELTATESIVRARLALEGNRLAVETNAEARADRIVAVLRQALPDAEVVADERAPLQPGETPSEFSRAGTDALVPPELREQIQDHLERRWVDDQVPALDGLTPRQAADDPTRRGDVKRLIDSFSDLPSDSGALAMRKPRLRALLDLGDPAPAR